MCSSHEQGVDKPVSDFQCHIKHESRIVMLNLFQHLFELIQIQIRHTADGTKIV